MLPEEENLVMLRKLSIIVMLALTSLSLTAFSAPASSAAEEEGNPWLLWVFVVVVLVAFVIFLIWWWSRGGGEEEGETLVPPGRPQVAGPAAEEAKEITTEMTAVKEVADATASPPPAPDDLKRIEGIGPKISSVLQAAGITTFAQLAEADSAQLEQILEEENPNLLRLANPGSWPEQARLAAGGQWEELEKLQDQLHGGREQA
jgi:predicted flap endonuclease-1-like 5' DNA nuclease